MATTKIWTIKDNLKRVLDYARNPQKTEIDDDLWAVLHYAARPQKVTRYDETTAFVTGVACSAENAYREMQSIKQQFGKTRGILAIHAYQSFKPGEVTPQECHEIGVNLARHLWGSRYQVLVTTHLDKDHLHNHFVVNSVSYTDGRKFDCSKRAYSQIRRVSDEMCRQRGLSVIEKPKGHTPRPIYEVEKRGEPTHYNLMRDAINKAISMSYTQEHFRLALLKMGYVYDANPNYKYQTIRSIHSKKAVRLWRLGEDYEPEAIKQKILRNPSYVKRQWTEFMYPQEKGRSKVQKTYRLKGNIQHTKTMPQLTGIFLVFGHYLGLYPNHHRYKPQSPEMKEACRFLDRFTEKVTLLGKHKLHTEDEVLGFIASTESKIEALCKERRRFYDRITRCDNEAEKAELRTKYSTFTTEITQLRKDLKTANRIIDELPKMQEGIQAERQTIALQKELEVPQKQKHREKMR